MSEQGIEGNAVDMLAEAREAQWSSLAFMGPDAVKAVAPAKVNLFLGVGKRREDGYHDVVNVMHSLALHDVLYMTCRTAEESWPAANDSHPSIAYAGLGECLRVRVEISDKAQLREYGALSEIPAKDNLVFKAIDLLARELGRKESQDIDIRIEKHIPAQAGLGGGSSDAAAILEAMAGFWDIPADSPSIQKVAASLGADVSFFLHGGCALFTGAGEVFQKSLMPMKHPVVVVRPKAGVSTKSAYSAFDENPIPIPAQLLEKAQDATSAEEVPLFNNLAPAAFKVEPELAEVVNWFGGQEGLVGECRFEDGKLDTHALLTGSGSAAYAIAKTYSDALRVAANAQARGWWSKATTFSSLRAVSIGGAE